MRMFRYSHITIDQLQLDGAEFNAPNRGGWAGIGTSSHVPQLSTSQASPVTLHRMRLELECVIRLMRSIVSGLRHQGPSHISLTANSPHVRSRRRPTERTSPMPTAPPCPYPPPPADWTVHIFIRYPTTASISRPHKIFVEILFGTRVLIGEEMNTAVTKVAL